MKHGRTLLILFISTIGSIPAASCRATPILGFQIAGATPSNVYQLPGTSFLVSVVVTGAGASSDQMEGLDYHFLASASNIFTVTTRNSQTGPFSNPYKTDAAVATGNQVLKPDTSFNLGGNTTNFATYTANGTADVADFLIQVSPTAPAAKYTFAFSNMSPDVLGYDTPSFTEASFASTGSFSVFTPEPNCIALLGVGMIGLRRHRRRRVMVME